MTDVRGIAVARRNEIFIQSLFALAIVLFIAIGTGISVFSYIALALSAGYLVLASNERAFGFMFFLLPFANVFKADSHSTSFFTYLTILLIVKLFVSKRWIGKRFMGAVLLLFVVQLIGSRMDYTILIKQAMILLLIYGYFHCCEPITEALTLHLTGGLCISCCLSYMTAIFPGISEYMRTVRAYEVSAELFRFTGLYSDPNYLSQVLILLCVALFILIQRKRIGRWYWAICLLCVFWGLRTISKTFFFMLVIIAVMLFVFAVKYRRYGILFFLTAGSAFFLIFAKDLSVVASIIKRLVSGDISTGRFSIWGQYAVYLIKHPLRLLFGAGIAADPLGYLPHSTYLDFLYYYGIFGTLVFVVGFCYAVRGKLKKAGILNCVPVICFSILGAVLSNLLMYDFGYLLIFIMTFLTEDERKGLVMNDDQCDRSRI